MLSGNSFLPHLYTPPSSTNRQTPWFYRTVCSNISNKSTNQMQQIFKSITWRLIVCTAQHVSGVLTPIIRSSTIAVAASDFTVGTWSSAVGRGRAGRHCYHHAPTVKPEVATAVVELLITGVRTPETCWAVHKSQVIKLEKLLHLVGWFIWIVW